MTWRSQWECRVIKFTEDTELGKLLNTVRGNAATQWDLDRQEEWANGGLCITKQNQCLSCGHSISTWFEFGVEGADRFPLSADCTFVTRAQDTVSHLCCQGMLLTRSCPADMSAHVSKSFSTELLPRQSGPRLYHCNGFFLPMCWT